MALPLSVRYGFHSNLGRENFEKAQRFCVLNNVPLEKILPERRSELFPKERKQPSDGNQTSDFSDCVFSFDAYLLEPVYLVSTQESYRCRKFKIFYYFEDDTIKVVEPKYRNSSMTQGIMFKRQKIKKTGSYGSKDPEFLTLSDFKIDSTIDIYGNHFKITGSNRFAKESSKELGTLAPFDPYEAQRKTEENKLGEVMPNSRGKLNAYESKLSKFLNFNPLYLTFYCYWKESGSMPSSLRKMILYYFLDDDKVEIVEKLGETSGKSNGKVFLSRGLLPKRLTGNLKPRDKPYEKVSTFERIYDIGDDNKFEYYTDKDLNVGKEINVYNRKFFLYDCNEFTRDYYRTKYNIELNPAVPQFPEIRPVITNTITPPELIGPFDKELRNATRLLPKPELNKRIDNDGQLKFVASVLTNDFILKSRKFEILYYLSDGTLSIREPYQRNSGIRDGRFLKRVKVPIPKEFKHGRRSLYYSAEDMFLGNILRIFGHDYLLLSSDEATLAFMENNGHQFIHSNFDIIMEKIKSSLLTVSEKVRSYFTSLDVHNDGYISVDGFRKAISKYIPEKIPEQEIITLARKYAKISDTTAPLKDLIAMAQTQLKRSIYDDFRNLTSTLKEYDSNNIGHFTKDKLYSLLRGCKVPVDRDLLKLLITKFPITANDCIDYIKFIQALDIFKNPVPLSQPVPYAYNINWKHIVTEKSLDQINYRAFVSDAVSLN